MSKTVLRLVTPEGNEIGRGVVKNGQAHLTGAAAAFSGLILMVGKKRLTLADGNDWLRALAAHLRTPYLRAMLDERAG
jgi:hypothetical protein